MWMDYKQSGLIVIGMPCDDFGHQEPGDEDTIAEFCGYGAYRTGSQ